MTCNSCETTFQGSQTLVVSVAKSESSAVLSVANQGRNIALISRILLGGARRYRTLVPPACDMHIVDSGRAGPHISCDCFSAFHPRFCQIVHGL